VLLFIGPPLAGKGTQANRLSNLLGIPAVSSGDIFRREAASGSELGQKMKSFMERGELIPNELTTALLTEKLGAKEFHGGFIMDGYPRNLSHLPIFDQILADIDYKVIASRVRLYYRLTESSIQSCASTTEKHY
jgi:adenylate kinase